MIKKMLRMSLALIVLGGVSDSFAQHDQDRAAIEAAVASYVDAYNARDAKALVSLWLPEGVYISRLTGDQITGHEALEKEFLELFAASEGTNLTAETESIEFVSPNVAIEQGRAEITHADKSTTKSSYSVVYVKRDGQWLIDRISEETTNDLDTHSDELGVLEWMIGDWVDSIGDATVTIECKWTKNKNYICRAFEISRENQVESTGMQIIGWDANKKQIRSWLFDSNSTFIEGIWNRNGDRWIVQSVATLADGGMGSSTSILRPIDDFNYGWQKINRVVDGQLLPNIEEVVISRK